MPKLIKDLTLAECDYWAARMQGWRESLTSGYWLSFTINPDFPTAACNEISHREILIKEYSPTTNGGQAIALAEKRHIQTGWDLVEGIMVPWASPADAYPGVHGETLSEAIVRAALTAHYGEEVPDA